MPAKFPASDSSDDGMDCGDTIKHTEIAFRKSTAEYIAAVTRELVLLSNDANLRFLSYLLKIALAEAERVCATRQ